MLKHKPLNSNIVIYKLDTDDFSVHKFWALNSNIVIYKHGELTRLHMRELPLNSNIVIYKLQYIIFLNISNICTKTQSNYNRKIMIN